MARAGQNLVIYHQWLIRTVGAGMQQALAYADMIDVPFVYSSNGDGFLEHDRTASGGTV